MNFFYRFDALDLIPGNKSSGFVLQVSTHALLALSKVTLNEVQRGTLLKQAQERVLRAQLMTKRMAAGLSIGFLDDSACPRFFVADAMFGGSVGTDPELFSRLRAPDAQTRVLDFHGNVVDYTPHNLDTPKQALALLVLIETWGELVTPLLYQVGDGHRAVRLAKSSTRPHRPIDSKVNRSLRTLAHFFLGVPQRFAHSCMTLVATRRRST